MYSQTPAIVIGLDCMTGLQTARVLARRGVPVIAIASDRHHFCCRTNVCERIIYNATSGPELLSCLADLQQQLGQKAVLVPCTDMSVLTISRARKQLEQGFLMRLADAETIELLMDKVQFYRYAQQHNLPIPTTYLLENRADAEHAAQSLSYPCILKPPIKTPLWESHTKVKAFQIASAEELLETYDMCAPWADLLMAQQWVNGGDDELYSSNSYFNTDSEALVMFVSRKVRQWPIKTGTSTMGIDYRNDTVVAETLRLFQGVGFAGLAYLELKRDSVTGQHYIIEPNINRPTGRSAMAEAAGVELLYTMYCDVVGLPLPSQRQQRYTGLKWVDIRRDTQAAAALWRRGELSGADWYRSLSGNLTHAIADRRDPMPFVGDVWRALRLAFGAATRKILKRANNQQTSAQAQEIMQVE